MATDSLSQKLADIIQQNLEIDTTKDYQQIEIRIAEEQYFVDFMSEKALVDGQLLAICEARTINGPQRHQIIVNAEYPNNLRAVFRVSSDEAHEIAAGDEKILIEDDVHRVSELAIKINKTINEQHRAELAEYGNKVISTAQRRLQQHEYIVDLLKSLSKQDKILFKLHGHATVPIFEGDSIEKLLDTYLAECKKQMQPHEIMSLEVPRILVSYTPDIALNYDNLDTQSRELVNAVTSVNPAAYERIFESKKRS